MNEVPQRLAELPQTRRAHGMRSYDVAGWLIEHATRQAVWLVALPGGCLPVVQSAGDNPDYCSLRLPTVAGAPLSEAD